MLFAADVFGVFVFYFVKCDRAFTNKLTCLSSVLSSSKQQLRATSQHCRNTIPVPTSCDLAPGVLATPRNRLGSFEASLTNLLTGFGPRIS